jgi:hypothetical protein
MRSPFLKLLERGFSVNINASLSIRELLCRQLGISEEYVDERIQTIFLNGKPVDNVDTAWVENGSRLALSAAMPGLVGATFRKGGFYSSFRDSISYAKKENSISKSSGKIILKLFNMVARELGPQLLSKGIQIEGNTFQDFVFRSSADLKSTCNSIHLNDTEIEADKLKEMEWVDRQVFVQVRTEKEV